ncbi:MAG: hypothetical protein COB35_05365 [Gammaproteobacteria bacterium]|nr:MAG: hypothetical protein COB35_05365 [Gammaproteobacteria bacterium]
MKTWQKNIIALLAGLAFAANLAWLTGFSAGIMPALSAHQWTKEHVEISLFFYNLYAFVLPLGIIAFFIGGLLGKLLKTNSTTVIALAATPAILIYLVFNLNLTDYHFWMLELPKIITIAAVTWFSIKKFGVQ